MSTYTYVLANSISNSTGKLREHKTYDEMTDVLRLQYFSLQLAWSVGGRWMA